MNYRYLLLVWLLTFIAERANAQSGAIGTSRTIDMDRLESHLSVSGMVILGDVKAISKMRRNEDVTGGHWVLTQYLVEVEDVILSSANAAPEMISFVSYGGDLVLPRKSGGESGAGSIAIEPDGLDSAGYKAVFQRFGLSQTVSHTASISQTGRYLIFILSSRQPGLIDGLRLSMAYRVRKVRGVEVVEMQSSSFKELTINYGALKSELASRSDLLDSYDF